MNTDTTKKVQAAEVTFADDAFSPLPEGALDQDQIARKKTTYFKDVWRNFKKNKPAVISLVVIAIMIFFVLFGPMMTKFDYYSNDYSCSNQGPNAVHWFGTDNLGRDLWTRVWAGGRVSLIIAILATLIPEIIGMAVGGISGYLGGWADTVIMRTIDVLMGIPSLIYMILLMVVMGSGNIATLVIAMSITGWMGAARSTRGLVLQLKTREFVVASETLGASSGWIIARRLIPNTLRHSRSQHYNVASKRHFLRSIFKLYRTWRDTAAAKLGSVNQGSRRDLPLLSIPIYHSVSVR